MAPRMPRNLRACWMNWPPQRSRKPLLQLDAIAFVAIGALRLDGVVGNLEAGGIGEFRTGNRLADGRYLRVEISLVLPDLLRRAERRIHHILLRIGRENCR